MSQAARSEDLTDCIKGQDALSAKQYAAAVDHFTLCIEAGDLQPKIMVSAYTDRALSYLYMGSITGAVDSTSKALELLPDHVPALLVQGVALLRGNQLEQAHAVLTRVTKIDPKDNRAWYWRGKTKEFYGDKEGATFDLVRSYRLGNRSPEIILLLQEKNVLAGMKGVTDIRMLLPERFVPAYSASSENQWIVEYVPEGESVEDWEEMITVTFAKVSPQVLTQRGGDAHAKIAEELFSEVMDGFEGLCAKSLRMPVFSPRYQDGSFYFIEGNISCQGVDQTKVPQGMHLRDNGFLRLKVMATGTSLVSFQYAWQSDEKTSSYVHSSGLLKRSMEPTLRTAEVGPLRD